MIEYKKKKSNSTDLNCLKKVLIDSMLFQLKPNYYLFDFKCKVLE